jgi:predicted nucleotide-binding protein
MDRASDRPVSFEIWGYETEVTMQADRNFLLAEIEAILQSMPPRATIRHRDNPDNVNWFGRVCAAIRKWNPSKSALAQEYVDLFFSHRHAREAGAGLNSLLILINEAKAELQSESEGVHMRRNAEAKVFIGHGRSLVWLQLKNFLTDRLHLACDEFNAESIAGRTTTARLEQMLDEAAFAFLVMTAEDTHADSTAHARENVIHEAGLFQGRLGFERAIILLEDGCAQFSNIHGLTHINFPKGNLETAFEKIRQVLERERVYPALDGFPASVARRGSESCPKCRKPGWQIESSAPDAVFGGLGVFRRVYKCVFCGFTEGKLSE